MKKLYVLCCALLVLNLFTSAKEVSKELAMQVAKNFYLQNNPVASSGISLSLIYTCKANEGVGTSIDGAPVYYVFDVSNNGGFVIVSGDDLVTPILGYNTQKRYTIENLPPALKKWMENYKQQILFVKHNRSITTNEITELWYDYTNNINVHGVSRSTQSVNALCQTQWNQAPNENGMCPYDNNYNERCVTGCVATAMSQILRFWSFPTQGTGNHSYQDQHYGTQSANFGNTTYNWSNMPYVLNSANNDVATLMYHCGVAVEMGYGVAETGGSSAYVVSSASPVQACAEYAYKTYFGYDPNSVHGIERQNYSDQDWTNAIKGEMDAGRPVQYAGFGQGGGHTWVCDGYDQNTYFHMNWGWGGNSDGYFPLSNLDPAALGAGGGTGGFNDRQQAVIGIKPINNGGGGGTINQDNIQLYAATTVTANPFVTGNAFTVYTDIANLGTSSFTGDFAAALFNSDGVFVQYIQVFTNQTAQAQMHYQVQFTTNALNLIPGLYYIGIYYKNGNNNYSLIDPGSFYNPVSITVTGPYSDIQMSGNTTITPTSPHVNQAFTIQTHIGNAGGATWNGYLEADLHDLQGNFIATIQSNSASLASNNSYTVTFNSNGLNQTAGTYYVAFWSTTDNQNYTLVYDLNYPNPVQMTLVDEVLNPDPYEQDNTEGTAHSFAVNFSGNNANVQTTGSNMHVGNDYDYYKIDLPGGTNYLVTPRLYDSYSDGGTGTYTNDGQFSYKVNSGAWSSTYDDVIDAPIYVPGGGTVTFFVADYFEGTTGTYLFNIDVQRGQNVGINEVTEGSMNVFPNPAHGLVYVDASAMKGNYELRMYDELGKMVSENHGQVTDQLLKQDVSRLQPGIYMVQLRTESGIANSKIVIQ